MKHLIAIATILLLVFAIFQYRNGSFNNVFLPADIQQTSDLSAAVAGNWFPLANGSYNAFVNWRWDWLIASAAQFINKLWYNDDLQHLSLFYHLICLSIGVISFFFLCLVFRPQRYYGALLCTLTWLIAQVSLWGCDSIIIDSFTWLPLFIITLICILRKNKSFLPLLIFAFFFSYRISLTANQLSIAVVSIGFIPAYICCRPELSRRSWILPVILLIPTIICLIKAPLPEAFDYPLDISTHLVTDDGLPGMIRPLVGPDAPTAPTIDRPFIKEAYGRPAEIFLLLLAIIGIPSAWRLKQRGLLGWSLLLTLLILLDVTCNEGISHIMPLATINRTIPHFFFFSLIPLTFAVAIFLFILHLRFSSFELGAFFIAAILIPQAKGALLQSPIAQHAKHDLLKMAAADPAKLELEKFLVSPSLHLINTYGTWILDYKFPAKAHYIDVAKLDPNVQFYDSDNSPAEKFENLKDRNWNTRWFTSQHGDKWILVRLSKALTLQAIEPTPSNKFFSDFPRGIRIKAAAACPAEAPLAADYKTIVNMPEWQGELKFTPSGYPYFANFSHVRINFKEPISAQCWLIERIGKPAAFDWSIAKIKVLTAEK